MSPISKLSEQLQLVRLTADHPLGQVQQTPTLPSTAIDPALAPLASRRSTSASDRPRSAEGIHQLIQEAVASVHQAPSLRDLVINDALTAASPAALPHRLLQLMAQESADVSAMMRSAFPRTLRASEAVRQLTQAVVTLDLSDTPPVPGFPSAPFVMVTLALAVGSHGDPVTALQGLTVLRGLDVMSDLTRAWEERDRVPTSEAGPSSTSPGVDAAWRTLGALTNTPVGLALSQALLPRPVPEEHRLNLMLLLKSATVVATQAGVALDPAALLRLPSTSTTLAGEALLYATACLAGASATAEPLRGALTSARNGLLEDGPGSAFHRINEQLMKMGRWVQRATTGLTTPEDTALPNPLQDKSPFKALRHGVQNVDRGPAIGRHRVQREKALHVAASALKNHLDQVAPRRQSPGPGQVPEGLLRAAVLEAALQTAGTGPLERTGLDETERQSVSARLASRLLGPNANEDRCAALAAQLVQLPEVQALAGLKLDVTTLARWTDDATLAEEAEEAVAPEEPTHTIGPLTALQTAGAALRTAADEALGRDTRVLDIDRETVRQALKDIIDNIEGSSRLRLSSGGITGVGLRQATATVSALASAMFLRARLDARLQQGRQAVFEIAMPPYDMEIVLASQRQSAQNFGLGAFIGPDVWAGKAGINIDATLWANEQNQLKGISLRLPRVGRPVPELRAEFSRLVDRLLDGSIGGANVSSDQPLLRRLFQEFPGLTVNQIADGGDGRRRHGLSAELAASIGAGWFKATGGAGLSVEGQRDVTRHYADASGRMQVSRSIVGHSNRLGATVRGTLGLSHPFTVNTGSAGKTEGTLAVLPAGVGAERILGGVFDRREEVYEDGQLHPLSFVEREFHDLRAFLAHLKDQLPAWLQAGAPPAQLESLLTDIATHAQPTHSFAARWIVTPETKVRDDALRSVIALLEPLPGHTSAVAALRDAIEAQWNDPRSLQPYSMRAYERNMRQQTTGLDVVVQLAAVDSAEAAHIDNRLDVKPRTTFSEPAVVASPYLGAADSPLHHPASPSPGTSSPPSPFSTPPHGWEHEAAPLREAFAAAGSFTPERVALRRQIEELEEREERGQLAPLQAPQHPAMRR